MRAIGLLLISIAVLAGCSQQSSRDVASDASVQAGSSVLGSLRPKADPAVIAQMNKEEADQQRMAQQDLTWSGDSETSTDAKVSLPEVSTALFAPPAEQVEESGPIITPAGQQDPAQNANPFAGADPTQAVASYGAFPGAIPSPPSSGGGLVPPPPAVSLSTQAQPLPYDPYANPYATAYGNPYANNPYYGQQQAQPRRAEGSLFGSGSSKGSSRASSSSEKASKVKDFIPITPTGMQARSAYKQRDDLKVLWSSALKSSGLKAAGDRDDKIAKSLRSVSVSLPRDATKGSFSVSQRQVTTIFKPAKLDKKVAGQVKGLQNNVVQSYYRYLYTYDKFALAQQTVAARKQEMEVASSASEKQRAAADLAQAKSHAQSSKEDMRSAQYELAAAAGAEGARAIIGRVSGVTPSMASLAQADPSSGGGSAGGESGDDKKGILRFLGFGKKKEDDKSNQKAVKIAAKSKEESGKGKGKTAKKAAADLKPAPRVAEESTEAKGGEEGQPVAFNLRKVKITPRKSILKVSIRNNGASDFKINPSGLIIAEGKRKLSNATVRADFESNSVAPNQEVAGTITIFGRPWNDKLSVLLSDKGNNIQMRR